jgi:NuA3 HAT complex component NTO1
MQAQMEQRQYVTGLSFAQELGDAICAGIAMPFEPPTNNGQHSSELADTSPVKGSFADIRERRKLGKRILKAVQPYVEIALQIEAEISNRSYGTLQAELEAIIEGSVEAKQNRPESVLESAPADDVEMADVADHAHNNADKPGEDDHEAMSVDQPDDPQDVTEEKHIDNGTAAVEEESNTREDSKPDSATDDTKPLTTTQAADSQTPPGTDGAYVALARPDQAGPPTPPQSNGSLGKVSVDPLSEGGIFWHLKAFQPKGTSVLAEQWPGRDAIRMLSEDLTDLDDDELKGLGVDVDLREAILTPADLDEDTGSSSAATGAKGKAGKVLSNTNAHQQRRTSARRR